jgi:hypothetical protein
MPLVELVDDETYGQETTNSGDKPASMDPPEGTDVDAVPKAEPSRSSKRR